MTNYDYDAAEYDKLINDANTDDRIGHHTVMVTRVTDDTWPSGDPRRKILFALTDVSGKADLTISPPPSPEVVAAESKSWDRGKKKAVASTVTLYRQLKEHYQTTPEAIQEGDTFSVNIIKTKVDSDGKGGFLRVVAFLPKGEGAKAASSDSPPF